jgi:glycosyl-4,4'-diaponeurosporenoate acyltransferase
VVTDLSFWVALPVDAAIWLVWSLVVGWWAARLGAARVGADGWLTRLRPWERDGRAYARVGIRRWKGWLPDAGRFGGGRPKVLGRRRDPDAWRHLAAETRRAERVHWIVLLALPVEATLNAGIVLVPMAVYAVVANVPCIAVQRYNRGRLGVLLRHRAQGWREHPLPS